MIRNLMLLGLSIAVSAQAEVVDMAGSEWATHSVLMPRGQGVLIATSTGELSWKDTSGALKRRWNCGDEERPRVERLEYWDELQAAGVIISRGYESSYRTPEFRVIDFKSGECVKVPIEGDWIATFYRQPNSKTVFVDTYSNHRQSIYAVKVGEWHPRPALAASVSVEFKSLKGSQDGRYLFREQKIGNGYRELILSLSDGSQAKSFLGVPSKYDYCSDRKTFLMGNYAAGAEGGQYSFKRVDLATGAVVFSREFALTDEWPDWIHLSKDCSTAVIFDSWRTPKLVDLETGALSDLPLDYNHGFGAANDAGTKYYATQYSGGVSFHERTPGQPAVLKAKFMTNKTFAMNSAFDTFYFAQNDGEQTQVMSVSLDALSAAPRVWGVVPKAKQEYRHDLTPSEDGRLLLLHQEGRVFLLK